MRIQLNYDLSAQNTFRMKVFCACWVEYETVKELEGLNFDKLPKPLLHIGAGSNLLFTKDFPGTVLHSNIEFIKYIDMGLQEVPVMVGAGVLWDNFVAETCRHGLWGAENLSLIPGEVGAAAVQNIGAYGVEVESIIREVETIEVSTGKAHVFQTAECEYGYRDSIFKQRLQGQYIVTAVVYHLSAVPAVHLDYGPLQQLRSRETVPTAQEIRDAVIAIRDTKLPRPEQLGSAGSFFKNPVVPAEVYQQLAANYADVPHYAVDEKQVKIPAAWLIEQCGWKGKRHGGAAVYEKQPLLLVNEHQATPTDIMELADLIQQSVLDKFHIQLNPEVNYI